ncbi:MAG TPA: DUF1275 family protein [Thermoleophilaceae bacterium]|nr:DUF1275 family protein [Thermoleophilaceae bacterium]
MKPGPDNGRYGLVVGLTATAGTLDALAFLNLGKVFNSFQSGNVLFLGLGAGGGDGGLVVRAAAVLVAFVAGAAVGARLIGARLRPGASRAEGRILTLEAALLAVFAALWLVIGTPSDHPAGRLVLLALGAGAMGVQAALSLALKIPNVVTVALTATLAFAGQRLGDTEREPDAGLPPMGLLVGVCATYAICAFVVALLPEAPALALAPLVLLTAAVSVDLGSRRAWHAV